ncbi:MAG: hypothetical protein QW250_07635 [Sulfolobaceae archaeon]
MLEVSGLVLELCTEVQYDGRPCKIITDSMTYGEKCVAEASDPCETRG